MDFLLILFFLSLKAFFVLGEYSLSRFSSYSEQDIANKNSLLFKIAYKISENFDKYEQTIKLGLIFSIFGFMGVSYHFFFNNHFSVWAQILGAISIELNNPNVQLLTIILFFLLNLIFIFVLGSVFPTSIAKHNITKSGLLSAPVVLVSHFLFYPITMFSDFINNFFERFFGFGLDTEENNQNIHDELKYLIEESSKLSEMDDEGRDLIENVFEFSNTTVKKIMTKRNDISALDIDDELNVIITKIINDGYSRYPVYKDSLDNIIGIVNVKDLFNSYINTPELPILEILRNAVYIIEDELIDNLLKIMKTQKVHLVIVRDEFGGTSGIITMEDILEEIVGEIHDEFDEDKKIFERITDNEIIVEAFIKISDLNKLLKEEIPESELYESLGGYLLQLTGTVPQIGDKIDVGNYSFVIIEGNKRRIQKVKIILKQLLE